MSAALLPTTASPPPAVLADDAPHLLVVDDDARIRTLLARYLAREGFRVCVAGSAAEARPRLANLAYDLLILDVMMPGETGFDFLAALRGEGGQASRVPVLMLTARGEPANRIKGFESGADDYLAKPFEARELLLRIQAILRRGVGLGENAAAEGEAPACVRFGPFVFHLARGELREGSASLRLTERERDLLRRLAEARGTVVPRAGLAGVASGAGDRSVDVLVTRLRRKVEADPAAPQHIQTVRGVGYLLMAEPVL